MASLALDLVTNRQILVGQRGWYRQKNQNRLCTSMCLREILCGRAAIKPPDSLGLSNLNLESGSYL